MGKADGLGDAQQQQRQEFWFLAPLGHGGVAVFAGVGVGLAWKRAISAVSWALPLTISTPSSASASREFMTPKERRTRSAMADRMFM